MNPVTCYSGLLLFVLCLLTTPAHSQTSSTWPAALDELLTNYQESSNPFNGILLVIGKEGVVYQRKQGYANLELQVPLELDTRFRIASISKQFAGFLAWKMVDEGKLDLSAPISDYVRRLKNTPAGAITLQQLLTHTSGLPPNKYIWEYAYQERPGNLTSTDLFDLFAQEQPRFEPGTDFEYCNSCYVLAAAVLEEVFGSTYPDLIRQSVLAPLGMLETGFDSLDAFIPGRAYPYEREFGQGLRPARPIDLAPLSAAVGMYSSAADLCRWVKNLFFEKKLLSDTAWEAFLRPVREEYAYGLWIREEKIDRQLRIPVIEHDGLLEGGRAYVAYLPEKQLGIVLLTNFGCSFPFATFQQDILRVIYGLPAEAPKKCLAYQFSLDLESGGPAYAEAQFRKNRQNTSSYSLRQKALNEYGYHLLRRKRFEAAIVAFRLNTEAFPNSWIAFSSLAEAYLKAGDEERAKECFGKALELNPGNRMCRKQYEKLGGK